MRTNKFLLSTLACALVCLPLASSVQAKETPARIYETANQKLVHGAVGENDGGSVARLQDMSREREQRIAAIHERYVFADIHAHPSRFHRANVERIGADRLSVGSVGSGHRGELYAEGARDGPGRSGQRGCDGVQ